MRLIPFTAICVSLVAAGFAMDVGKPTPPLTIKQLHGAPIDINQYKGKVVAIAFIDTTCSHCQHLTGLLNTISKQYAGRPVEIVGCAFNDGAQQALPQFIQQFQPNFPIGYCSREAVLNYLSYPVLEPLYVPHMVFLDKRGIVRGDYRGESDFLSHPETQIPAELDQLLKGGTATSSIVKHKQQQ
ncbi:MAG: TlpA family protein disulfide reductase [Acidobacteriia bacterium]|nr:TlpA family protein disulfide reductase [Terriglobia bacterium]